MGIVLVIGAVVLLFILFAGIKPSDIEEKICKRVHECKNIRELVSSIGYGRVYPYYTSMPIEEVRKIIVRDNKGISEFESSVEFNRITGGFGGIALPTPECNDIKDVRAQLSRNGAISAITIELKNEQAKWEAYMYLTQKFGESFTNSKEFAIWRNRYMVINIDHNNNSINIIDERLLRF